jgi:Mrp family chromosome partitioning ATPase
MARNVNHWKNELPDIQLLADLSRVDCVDELFRPYLSLDDWRSEEYVDELFRPFLSAPVSRAIARQPVPSSLPAPPQTMRQGFDVVVRSAAHSCVAEKHEALMPPHVDNQLTPAPAQPPAVVEEKAPPVVLPRVAVPAPPPLPHEVREELLELRAEVMQAVHTRHLQTLMLCGVEPGAGTSFVAAQLTRLLAEYVQMKVALLTLLPSEEKKANRLSRRAAPRQLQFLLRRTELPNLAEIASANGTITLTELLCHCATTDVLQQMKAEFDLIVIDAPAVAMHSEVAALAALMDGVILVAEPNVTPLRRLDRAHRRLHKAHAQVLGMVFNRQRRH